MKSVWLTWTALALVAGCGEKKEEKKDDGFEMSRTRKEEIGVLQGKGINDNLVTLGLKFAGHALIVGRQTSSQRMGRGDDNYFTHGCKVMRFNEMSFPS